MSKAVFIYPSMADYHADRLLAADSVLKENGVESHVIEVFANQTFYNHKQNRIDIARSYFGSRWISCSTSEEGSPLKPNGFFVLISALLKLRPKVIFVYGYQYIGAWGAIFISKIFNMKVILLTDSKADDGIRNQYKEWFKRQIVKHFDGAFVAGKKHVEYVESLGIMQGVSVTGLDVVDNDRFENLVSIARTMKCSEKNDGEIVFLVVARLVERKGVENLLKAFSMMLADEKIPIRLWVAGEGELRKHLEVTSSILEIQESVNFFGSCTNDKIAYYMAHCDCLVLPSDYDQWGLVVNEAMVASLPVIVTETCGCAGEIVNNEIEGLIVPPKDVESLAAALRKMTVNTTFRKKLGSRGTQRIKQFSLQTWAHTVCCLVSNIK